MMVNLGKPVSVYQLLPWDATPERPPHLGDDPLGNPASEASGDRVCDWFRAVLASKTKDLKADTRTQRAELQQQESLIGAQQDRLLNLRIDGLINDDTFNRKQAELLDRLASIMLQIEVLNRSPDENAELASTVFELSQTLREKWLAADYHEKRKILEIVRLNGSLVDSSLVPTIRKPFDALAEGLSVPESGGGGN